MSWIRLEKLKRYWIQQNRKLSQPQARTQKLSIAPLYSAEHPKRPHYFCFQRLSMSSLISSPLGVFCLWRLDIEPAWVVDGTPLDIRPSSVCVWHWHEEQFYTIFDYYWIAQFSNIRNNTWSMSIFYNYKPFKWVDLRTHASMKFYPITFVFFIRTTKISPNSFSVIINISCTKVLILDTNFNFSNFKKLL